MTWLLVAGDGWIVAPLPLLVLAIACVALSAACRSIPGRSS